MKHKLLIVWSSADKEIAKKLILLYGGVVLPRNYWDETTIMIWGPSARLIAQDNELQEKIKEVMQTGVKFNCCVVCSDEYEVSKNLESLGIELTHTGEMLTTALKEDWRVITF